jgi:hypothetical protein
MARHQLSVCRQSQRSRASAMPPLTPFAKAPLPTINPISDQEERHEPRFPRKFEVRYRELSVNSESLYSCFSGEIANMSSGGMCLSTNRPLTPYSCIRCEVTLPSSPVGVPSLLQVRWVREVEEGVYQSGLLYLM